MKKHLLFKFLLTFTLALFTVGWVNGQTTIAVQDFDGGTPEWSYSNDVTFFDNTWGDDGYYGIIAASSASPLDMTIFSGNIIGENDLDDEGDNGTAGFATLSFGNVDISSYTNVEITFDYDVVGYNATDDDAKYIVYYDGTPQSDVLIVDGGVDPTDAEGSITISVPGGTNTVALDIAVRDNGSTGYSGFDNIKITGFSTPVFQSSTPAVSNTYDVQTNLDIELDQAAEVYYDVVTPSGGTAPDAATLKATATTNTTFFSVTEANVLTTELIGGLSAGTSYDIFVAAENAANQITSVQTVTFSTKTGAPSITIDNEPLGPYNAGVTATVNFTATNTDYVDIKVYDPIDDMWIFPDPAMEMYDATLGTIDIDIPADARTSSNYKLAIIAYGNEEVADTSAAFTITDVTKPTVETFSPADENANVTIDATLGIEFSEYIQAGTGNIYLKLTEDNSTFETIDITNTSKVTFDDTMVYVLHSKLNILKDYYVEIDATAIEDLSGNAFAGISDATTWNFKTNNLIYSEDFEDGTFGEMDTASISGDTKEWYIDGTFAVMNGFNSGELETDWLISPSINLDNSTYEKLTFNSWFNYGADDADNYLKLYYSIDYDGNNAHIETSNWTELTYTAPSSASTWTSSGKIDLSAIEGNVYFAFKYNYNAGSYRSWQIDDIQITGLGAGVPNFTVDTVDNVYDTQFDFQFQIDVPGTVYYFNEPGSGTTPTSAEIKASGNSVEVTDPEKLFNITLTTDSAGNPIAAGGTYNLWYTVEDQAGEKIGSEMNITVNTKLSSPTLTVENLVNGPYTTPAFDTVFWTADNIDNINLEIWNPIEQLWFMTDSSTQYNMDADLDTLVVNIPEDAPSSTEWMIRLVPVSYPAAADSTDKFEIIDGVAPTVDIFTPANGDSDVDIFLDYGNEEGYLSVEFNEPIQLGTGNIKLYKETDALVETFDISTSNQVMIDDLDNEKLLIYPTVPLKGNTSYNVTIDGTVITDISDNAYAGISNHTTWEFTTANKNVYDVSIYDIQYTEDASGSSPYENDTVMVTGIVTASNASSYFIQDASEAWHGIYVYDNNAPAVGDSIKIIAKVKEFYGLTELHSLLSYELIESGLTVPPAIILTTNAVNDEQYEGVLVKIEAAECTDTTDFYKYGEWLVNDGTGTLMVDDMFYEYTPTEEKVYTITGPVNYSYSVFRINARNADDLHDHPLIEVSLNPATPTSSDDVTVTATITDEEVTADALNASLFYGSSEGSETNEVTDFTQVETSDNFQGIIPASVNTVYYKVTASDGTYDSEQTGSYSITTGIGNPDGIVSMNIFPNPSNGLFTLEMNASKAGTFNVQIINIQGQVVYNKEVNQDGFYKDQIDISNEASGIYYIRINDGKNTKVSKIMIQ